MYLVKLSHKIGSVVSLKSQPAELKVRNLATDVQPNQRQGKR